ncbi:MAG: hypothetical protein JWR01_809 [Subtercola sp.]|nr:hypothetical protein [Subtercola sp.]
MSEPYGFCLRLKVDDDALRSYLLSPVPSPLEWSDWSTIGGSWTSFSWAESGERMLQGLADRLAGDTAAEVWVRFLDRSNDCGTFRWDAGTRELIAFQLWFAENLEDFLALALVCRSLELFGSADRAGGMIVRDFCWSEPVPLGSTLAILFEGGRSRVACLADDVDAMGVIALEEEADRFATARLRGGVSPVAGDAQSPAVAELRAFLGG